MTIKIPETDKKFYALFYQYEVYKTALGNGYDNAVFWDGSGLSSDVIEEIKKSGKPVLLLFFTDNKKHDILWDTFEANGIEFTSYNIDDYIYASGLAEDDDNYDGSVYSDYKNRYLPDPDTLNSVIRLLSRIKQTDYKGLCGNCHEPLSEDAKYCYNCGTRK